MHIIESFFFPPDLPARPNFTPDSNAKWASVAAYLPMFSMVGVFSFMKLRKKKYKWLKYLLPILFLCALVPIFAEFHIISLCNGLPMSPAIHKLAFVNIANHFVS